MATVYRSKVDGWLFAVMLAGVAAPALTIAAMPHGVPPSARWIVLAAAWMAVVLPLWVLISTRYVLEPQRLVVHSGPFRWSIPLASISGVARSDSRLSSPALSMDRLRIDYAGKSLLISPRDQARFLRQLEALRHGAHR